MKRIVIVLAVLIVLGGCSESPRQNPEPQCFPACRDGYICDPTGKCVEACNPKCPSGYECQTVMGYAEEREIGCRKLE